MLNYLHCERVAGVVLLELNFLCNSKTVYVVDLSGWNSQVDYFIRKLSSHTKVISTWGEGQSAFMGNVTWQSLFEMRCLQGQMQEKFPIDLCK